MSAIEDTRVGEGVRLLSHRPSVLHRVEELAELLGDDAGLEDLALCGAGWEGRLRALLAGLSLSERACVFAVRLDERDALPVPADKLLDRARADWFPEFLSHGRLRAEFQPVVGLTDGRVLGREVLVRGTMGGTEVRGSELVAAAEAHDALYSFDARARAAALEAAVPLLPEGELLFVSLDPRPVLDVESSLRTLWPLVERLGIAPQRVCLDLVRPERGPDAALVAGLAAAHRARGAKVGIDELSAGTASLAQLEALRPDVAWLDRELTAEVERAAGRRRIVAALVAHAHDLSCRVVARGVERADEFHALRDLGVDLGQGPYFGQATERPMAVDPRVVRRTL